MSNLVRHSYHLVDESWWPLISCAGSFFITSGLIKWFYTNSMNLLVMGLSVVILVMFQWWRDISSESAYQGLHTLMVELGLRYGMMLFITSEIMFFFSFFWAFFHSSVSPANEIGGSWPPAGIYFFNPMEVPLLNTIILLSSGITVTWAHHSLMSKNHSQATQALFLTIVMGAYFTLLQIFEYYEASFSLADSVFGSTFFVATGFHGLHVIVGTLFLLACFTRLLKGQFSVTHHFGFEAAAWYWHFVDVVWLFLYMVMYWWSSL